MSKISNIWTDINLKKGLVFYLFAMKYNLNVFSQQWYQGFLHSPLSYICDNSTDDWTYFCIRYHVIILIENSAGIIIVLIIILTSPGRTKLQSVRIVLMSPRRTKRVYNSRRRSIISKLEKLLSTYVLLWNVMNQWCEN